MPTPTPHQRAARLTPENAGRNFKYPHIQVDFGPVMNKSELIAALSIADGIPEKKAAQVVELILAEMTEALRRGDRVEIRGFGSLVVKDYPTYQGRNPRSRESITVEGKRLPHFKVGKELRARINGEPLEDSEESHSPVAPASSTDGSAPILGQAEPRDTD